MKQTPDEQVNKCSFGTTQSLDALEKFTTPIVEHFINALTSEDRWVRYLATDALGNMGDLRLIAPAHLHGPEKGLDQKFAQSLRKIGNIREVLADTQKMGCDTCLIRFIAEEALDKQNRAVISRSLW